MFSLELSDTPENIDESKFFRGRIIVGDDSEGFLAAAWLWTAERYRQQWKQAATTLLGDIGKSAFVTSFIHPDAHHNVAWAAWREGPLVHFQERLVFRELIGGVLDVDQIHLIVGSRREKDEDGNQLSTWTTSTDDVSAFVA